MGTGSKTMETGGTLCPTICFMKRAILLIGGVLWLGFALGFGVFLVEYIGGGAGLQFFGGPVSSGSVLLGLVHLVGFGTAIFLCFAIGVGLCARGIVEKDRKEQDDGKVTE